MFRRTVSLIVTLCLCWQALAFAGVGAVVAPSEDQRHALLHFEGVAHHHDGHGDGFHEDASPASLQHVAADAGQFSVALVSSPVLLMPWVPPQRPRSHGPLALAPPYLDGLERPPRPAA